VTSNSERRMLGRTELSKYINPQVLPQQTGCDLSDLDDFILKELVDNALDACDEPSTPTVDIVFDTDQLLTLTVRDNGIGLTQGRVKKIMDFNKSYSTKSCYKYPTRGALGNALKCVIGAPYALCKTHNLSYISYPFKIVSHGKEHRIQLKVNESEESFKPETTNREIEPKTGSEVSVTLPIYDDIWGWNSTYPRLTKGYALFNPDMDISLTVRHAKQSASPLIERYQPTGKASKKFSGTSSIHWYSDVEFKELIRATILDIKSGGKNETVKQFITGFRGLSSDRLATKVSREINRQQFDIRLLTDLEDKDELILQLYEAMKKYSKEPSSSVLGEIGKTQLYHRIDQVYGILDPRWFNYKKRRGIFKHDGASIPYVLEVAVAAVKTNIVQIHMGINHSPCLGNPFSETYLSWKDSQGKDQETYGIGSFLEKYDISPQTPIVLVVHLICPSVKYKSYGKSEIDTIPLQDHLATLLYKACKFYPKAKKRIEKALKGGASQNDTIKQAVFIALPSAIDHTSSHGKYKFKVRQLWYKVRALLPLDLGPEYDYFTPKLTSEYEERFGKIPGMLKEANAELHVSHDDKVIPLSTEEVESYEVPDHLYNKILYVEKRGFKDVLIANNFQNKYDIAIIGAQGQSSFDTRKLLRKIDAKNDITILCVHDADSGGCMISYTLANPSKLLKDHRIKVIDLGLRPREAMELGLPTEEARIENEIQKELLTFLEPEEIEFLRGTPAPPNAKHKYIGKRVELNAFTPEEFINWVTKKLEKHGIKEKVCPPSEVIADKAQTTLKEGLEKVVSQSIIEAVGGKSLVKGIMGENYQERNLQSLDLESNVKDALKSYPEEGWAEIVEALVHSHLAKISNDPTVRNKILQRIIAHLQKMSNLSHPISKLNGK